MGNSPIKKIARGGWSGLELTGTLELPLKVSENKRLSKKSLLWLPWQLFDNLVLFANNFRYHTFQGVKIKLCVMIALFSYFCKNVILKWVEESDFWEGLVEK